MSTNNLLGEAGKYRAASELLLRGFHVLVPAVDEGVDLFTEEGHGIQVKAAHLSSENRDGKNSKNNYHFHFKSWTTKAGYKRQRFGRLHPGVTHIVLWCVDDNAFVIIPRTVVGTPKHIIISRRSLTKGCSKWRPYLEAWGHFEDTKTLTATV